MIKVVARYKVKTRPLFEKRVIPYAYGSGQHFPELATNIKRAGKNIEAKITTQSISQLVDATIGMLRFSPDSFITDLRVISQTQRHKSRSMLNQNRPLVGAILKPALASIASHKKIIGLAKQLRYDFVKDDDLVEYSAERVARIYRLCGSRLVYFRKVSKQKQFSRRPSMIVPWIDGWSLAEAFTATPNAPLMIHCANMPLQVSWAVHITLARLVGASFVIVPDPAFDRAVRLAEVLQAASKPVQNISSVRLLFAGAVTPTRIRAITQRTPHKHRGLIGFTIGSWLLKKYPSA
ncbi:hypothetical protein A2118_01740 [Candidatus Kaiserbacteria bacterium GWA2_50_9]|uniref:Uncharacterized protein n=1 Tax=Candidatus Kaiserbacteria bacterium GWA2_50_9 TaxID=1798474 RepID=A0A1F6BVL6_9BACT|nr:MAG: hypothetical protein A2118_01740 [Candidatus Kaiserbacteria bacterium GWA2_50_9]